LTVGGARPKLISTFAPVVEPPRADDSPSETSGMTTRTSSALPERTPPAGARLDGAVLPKRFESVEALDDFLATPTQALVDDLAKAPGDILILGVAGKMGPTLARLAKNAAPDRRVIGVARFSDKAVQARLDAAGVETIAADLLNRAEIDALPRVPNVVFAAGHKFGASGNPALTWAMNTWVPALVAESFRESRIVAFSTGNVYPLTTIGRQAASEATPPAPVGDYAQSCVGRERMFEYFSGRYGTPGRIFRLNYAIDMRYGVLADIAGKIKRGQPVDVTMGHVNVIWQGDANAQVLRCLAHCTTPTTPINCTGPETLSVRWLAAELGARLGIAPQVTGQEAPTALLSDTTRAAALFGYPRVPMGAMLDWVADWVGAERESFNKPTKFEVRDGDF
jgi:nucleoside-diphosphate-sugar epimerase